MKFIDVRSSFTHHALPSQPMQHCNISSNKLVAICPISLKFTGSCTLSPALEIVHFNNQSLCCGLERNVRVVDSRDLGVQPLNLGFELRRQRCIFFGFLCIWSSYWRFQIWQGLWKNERKWGERGGKDKEFISNYHMASYAACATHHVSQGDDDHPYCKDGQCQLGQMQGRLMVIRGLSLFCLLSSNQSIKLWGPSLTCMHVSSQIDPDVDHDKLLKNPPVSVIWS